MSPQVQVKSPGYGIVYPDGVTGLKIVGAFTQAPHKVFNPDQSVSYTIPTPVIYELFGGGFAYSDGNPVGDRAHLEAISDSKMRERALAWFDSHGGISEEATKDVPPLDLEHQKKPETVYVLSSDLPEEKDAVTVGLTEHIKKVEGGTGTDPFSQIISRLDLISINLKDQGKRIDKLEAGSNPLRESRKKQSEKMKAKWADPEYREKRLGNKGFVSEFTSGLPRGNKDGNNIPETTKEV